MDQINLGVVNVTAGKKEDVIDTLAALYGYNGEGTKVDFLRKRVREHLKNEYLRAKRLELARLVAQQQGNVSEVEFT